MNNYFMNITKNLDSKSSTVSDTKDIDQITGCLMNILLILYRRRIIDQSVYY